MYFNFKHRVILITYLICALFVIAESKRGGGGRRGGTYRGSSVWSKSKQSQSGSNYDLYGSNRRGSKSQLEESKTVVKPDIPKASAPPLPNAKDGQKSSSAFINKEKQHDSVPKPIGFEQANKNAPNNQQRPIGWDVNHGNVQTQTVNKNVASGNPSGINNPTHIASGNPSGMNNPTHVASGNPSGIYNPSHITGQQTYPSYNNHQQSYQSNIGNHASYPVQPGTNTYGTGQHYNYGNVHNQPQQQFPGYQQGGVPYQTPNTGLHYNNMGYSQGYSNSYGGGGYGGGYGHSGGMFGSMFGGNNHGYGGYGGYGSGIGGYGKKFGGGFGMGFGKNAYRNAFFGLLVWNLFSGFTRRPYYVYNYYNNPEKAPKEISLPANLIVLCPENVTTLCAPNTAPLCTSNSTILCVVLAQETVPCEDNSNLKCAKSVVTCGEGSNENCQEASTTNKTAAVNVPCITNATIMGKPSGQVSSFNGTNDTTNFCVTTIAVPQPEDDIKAAEAAGCGPTSEQGQNSTCNPNVVSPLHNTTITNLNSTYPLAM